MKLLTDYVEKWHERLMDISGFMRVPVRLIRKTNAQGASGACFCVLQNRHIIHPVYKGQAILDEAALAACLAYVDLKTIREKMAGTPETSDHIFIKCNYSAQFI